ncbi:toprim domain-containing protein [Paenibacillus sp. FSL H3-0333]|uniref:toprim domain-containing protein n=1 Tax=Paenibacillus sp. FSL H3-0333 TaxID=2921373 RepID=UPI0030FC31F9
MSFSKAMYYICEVCGYSYYADYKYVKEDVDPCIAFLDLIEPKLNHRDEVPLRRLDEQILKMYVPYPNQLFLTEGISVETQKLFEIGYSINDNCITIPIRDELGTLVGIKGRTTLDYKRLKIPKYWFPIPTPKSQILYGLDKTYDHIKANGKVIVFEAEKSVQKAWSYGIKNSVSIGGHELSDAQVLKLERMGVEVILAFDNNISANELKSEAAKFVIRDYVSCVIAHRNKGVLGEKDAPIDHGVELFTKLLNEDRYKIPV